MGRPMDPEVVDLVERNLDLVTRTVAVLAARLPRHVEHEELRRAGALGLVEAAHRFDGTRGVPFPAFAVARIRGAVIDALRTVDWAPRAVRAAARRFDLVEGALTARLGRPATVTEIAAESGVDVDEVRRVRVMVSVASVDTIHRELGVDDDGAAIELLVDPDQSEPGDDLVRAELVASLREALDSLPARQRRVIEGYFLEGRRSEELAVELHVTPSRISQLRTLGLAELRRAILGRDRPVGPVDRETVTPGLGQAVLADSA